VYGVIPAPGIIQQTATTIRSGHLNSGARPQGEWRWVSRVRARVRVVGQGQAGQGQARPGQGLGPGLRAWQSVVAFSHAGDVQRSAP
jgi:hypothetical protein